MRLLLIENLNFDDFEPQKVFKSSKTFNLTHIAVAFLQIACTTQFNEPHIALASGIFFLGLECGLKGKQCFNDVYNVWYTLYTMCAHWVYDELAVFLIAEEWLWNPKFGSFLSTSLHSTRYI